MKKNNENEEILKRLGIADLRRSDQKTLAKGIHA